MSVVIRETDNYARVRSRADQYHQQHGIDSYLKYIAPGEKLLPGLKTDEAPEMLKAHYNLHSLYFGNWVTNVDRHNYIHLLDLSFGLLNHILKFKRNNIGFGALSISIGGRGRGKALAHYEPQTLIINVTRYERGPEPREVRLAATGGMASLAHEYGHFLDYFFGRVYTHSSFASLSGGCLTRPGKIHDGNTHPARLAMDNLMHAIYSLDKYIPRLKKAEPKNKYWHQRNEIFARCFEAYISYSLRQKKSGLIIMAERRYEPDYYPSDLEMKMLVPHFRKLLTIFRNSPAINKIKN